MSDGKKFVKPESNLTPEQRLDELERKYSVIQERIQAYNQVLAEFANISSDLKAHKQFIQHIEESMKARNELFREKTDILSSKINEIKKNQDLITSSLNDQKVAQQSTRDHMHRTHEALQHDIDVLHSNVGINAAEYAKIYQSLSVLEKSLSSLNKSFDEHKRESNAEGFEHSAFKTFTRSALDALKAQMAKLLSSFQEMPQFNEWATKIYIKVCNDINDKQKAFYFELDKRSQQLKEQLASDPYTAESVKKILKTEMDALAMDGKNAYLKAANASQQIQLLEKKVENINLILKKYELNK